MTNSLNDDPDRTCDSTGLNDIRRVADCLPQLAWSCLPDGHCDYLNRRWVEFTGVPEERHHGRGWLDAVHPDDRDRTGEGWDAFVAGAAPYDVEYRLRRHDGEYRWFKTRGVLIRDSSGRPTRVLGSTTDIHDQKVAEEDVRAILETISDAFFSLDHDWRFTYVNRQAERLLGRSRDELLGRSIWEEFAPAIGTEFERAYRRAASQKATVRFEAFYAPLDCWYEVNACPSPGGISVYFRDVNERRKADERRRFLSELATSTQPMIDPAAVSATTARLLAEHLGCDRCAYAEVEDESIYVITGDYARGVGSIVGRWPVAAFGDEHLRMMRADQAWVVHDVDGDSRIGASDRDAYRATQIASVVCVPLHKAGRFTAAMAVHMAEPRRWTADDVDLVRTVVAGCWETLERTRADRRLRESEERFRSLFDTLDDGYCLVEPLFDEAGAAVDYRYLLVNPALERHTGLQNVVGKTAREVMPGHEQVWIDAYAEVARTGVPFRRVGWVEDLGRWYEVTAARVGEAAGAQVGVLFADVSDRLKAEEALRASEERFRAFMDHSPTSAWITDSDGTIEYVSATYSRMFNVPDGELLGSSPADLYPAEFAREYVQNIRAVAESGRPLETIEPAPRPDGSVGQFLVYKFSLPGRRIGGVAVDVTERLRAEQQLREADRRKDEFLAILAHELRNPLAPIRNGLQVMQLTGGTGDAAVRARGIMDRQLTHLVRIVDDLLDVSRISRNKLELRRERLLLADVLSASVETVRPLLDQMQHVFTVSLPDESVALFGDLTRLAQVFSNLLTNAAKYTKPGGAISLTAEQSSSEVVVAVQDTGIGIPEEAMPRIFEIFSQVDRAIERQAGGLGIGLALVKGLVEMHGGSVSAESNGKGSVFKVRLPITGVESGREDSAKDASSSLPRGPKRKVLVVDDNLDAATSMAAMLELLGHEVRTAHDGVDAVDAAEAFRPDAVFMDVGMPRMNGYEATTRIRERPWGSAVTIVAVTGWGQQDDRARSFAAGCDGHLVKPVHLKDVAAFVERSVVGRS